MADDSIATLLYQFFAWSCLSASFFSKLPQVSNVIRNKSADGLSTSGILFELWAFTAGFSYQFVNDQPLMQYADYVALLVQEIPLVLLVLYYNNAFNSKTMIFGAVYVAVFGSVLSRQSSVAFNVALIVRFSLYSS